MKFIDVVILVLTFVILFLIFFIKFKDSKKGKCFSCPYNKGCNKFKKDCNR